MGRPKLQADSTFTTRTLVISKFLNRSIFLFELSLAPHSQISGKVMSSYLATVP